MNVWAKIGVAILGWLGIIEAIVLAVTRLNLHDAFLALIIYAGIVGLVSLVCLLLATVFWIMDG